jgi:quinol monooxygenase YgiN
MYLSRLTFHTQPGKTRAVEQELRQLMAMVSQVGGLRARALRNHFASAGAADVVFEQEAADLAMLEAQIKHVTETTEFQQWSERMSGMLTQSPKREMYLIVEYT